MPNINLMDAVRDRIRPTYVLVAILLILLVLLVQWSRNQAREESARVMHTSEVLRHLDRLLADLNAAESAQRGFLLTGSEDYLRPFDSSIEGASARMHKLGELTAGDTAQHDAIMRLTKAVEAKITNLRLTLMVNRYSSAAALDVMKGNRGEALTRQVREIAGSFYDAQERLLEDRTQERLERVRRVDRTLTFVTLVITGLLAWAGRAISVSAAARDRANREVQQLNNSLRSQLQEIDSLNKSLEQRVKERTTELEHANQNLIRLNADLERFAYIASHDLQEPVRMIGTYMSLLREKYGDRLDDTGQTYVRFAVDGAARMHALIGDLLAYSRLGTDALQIAAVPLDDVVANAVEGLRLAVSDSGAALSVDALPTVFADGARLGQVFQNLLTNAIKFSSPDRPPQIHISAVDGAGSWQISVRDNGIGFDPEYSTQIFEMFQRLHGKRRYPGTGIGLAICKRIVESHGGKLWAESQPGTGSTFYFTIPSSRPGQGPNKSRPGDRTTQV